MRDVPADEVRRVTEEVLGSEEFAAPRLSWLEDFFRRIGEYLDGVIVVPDAGGSASLVGTVILVVVALAIVILLAVFSRSVRRDPTRRVAVDSDIGRGSDQWLEDARSHESAGRWRDALRCRYRALLSALAEHGLVEEVPGRTTGEYLAAVRDDVPDAAEPFAAVTRQFEGAWYGHRDVAAAHIDEFTDHARRVLRAAGVRVPAGAGR